MAKLTDFLTSPTIETLGLTLLHFLWQGVLVALIIVAGLFLLKQASASLRYWFAFTGLITMLVLPVVTYAYLAPSTTPQSTRLEVQPLRSNEALSTPTLQTNNAFPEEQPLSQSEQARQAAPTSGSSITGTEIRIQPNSKKRLSLNTLTPYLPLLVAFWLLGVTVLSLRLMGGLWLTYQLRFRSTKAVPKALEARFKALLQQSNIKAAVKLRESLIVSVPVVIGCLRPVVLLPTAALTGLSGQQLELILLHELAHIRRYDFLFNILQKVVETLLFYHPAVWWLSTVVRQEREHCCDDAVLEHRQDKMLSYAKTLSQLESIRASNQLAIAATDGSLLKRVQRLAGKPSSGNPLEWLVGVTLLITLVLFFSSSTAQVAFPAELEQNIDTFMENRLEAWGAPGAQVAVIQEGQISFNKAYGFADLETSREMTVDTPIRLGPEGGFYFLMLAVHQLIDEELLSFEDTVSEVLPWLRFKNGEESTITVGSLTGDNPTGSPTYIVDSIYPENVGAFFEVAKPGDLNPDIDTAEAYMRSLMPDGLRTTGRMQSSFLNHDTLLILMVEQVSGLAFEAYMRQNVFEPLGMNATFETETARKLGLARFYNNNRGTAEPIAQPVDIVIPSAFEPALGLSMSSKDMAKFVAAISTRHPDILSEEAWEEFAPSDDGENSNGWKALTGSLGGTFGSETIMEYIPSIQTGYVVMMNYRSNQVSDPPGFDILQSISVSLEIFKEDSLVLRRGLQENDYISPSSFFIDIVKGRYVSSLGPLELFAKDDELHGTLLGHDLKLDRFATQVYVTSSDYEPLDGLILSMRDTRLLIDTRLFAIKEE